MVYIGLAHFRIIVDQPMGIESKIDYEMIYARKASPQFTGVQNSHLVLCPIETITLLETNISPTSRHFWRWFSFSKGPGRIALVLGGHSIFQLIPVRSNRKDPYSPKIGFLVHVPCVCWSCCVSLCFIWRVSAFFRWLNFGVRFFLAHRTKAARF